MGRCRVGRVGHCLPKIWLDGHNAFGPTNGMFGFIVGFSGSADLMVQLSNFKIQDGGRRPSWIYKSGHNFATGWPIYVVFDNINRKSLTSCGLSIGCIDELRSLR